MDRKHPAKHHDRTVSAFLHHFACVSCPARFLVPCMQVDKLLNLQLLQSEAQSGKPAHDELLFVIIHQGSPPLPLPLHFDSCYLLPARSPPHGARLGCLQQCFLCLTPKMSLLCVAVYELWFKQVLHELDWVRNTFTAEVRSLCLSCCTIQINY